MNLAREAATWSKDPQTKVGASLVTRKKILLGVGFNGFPRGIQETPERLQKPLDNCYYTHAEVNLFMNCASMGLATEGTTLYVTHSPCIHCTHAIIQAGVARVVIDTACHSSAFYQKHKENCELAIEMMKEANIQVDFL